MLQNLSKFYKTFPRKIATYISNSNSIWKQWMKNHLVEMPLQIPIIINIYYYISWKFYATWKRTCAGI